MAMDIKSDIFNSFTMIISSSDYYFSTIVLVLATLLFDIGIQRLLLLFGVIEDPLKITTKKFEEKYELTNIEFEPKKEINNRCKYF